MENKYNNKSWQAIKGEIREKWGDISDNELEKTKGNIDQIVGRVREKYSDDVKHVQKEVNEILGRFKEAI